MDSLTCSISSMVFASTFCVALSTCAVRSTSARSVYWCVLVCGQCAHAPLSAFFISNRLSCSNACATVNAANTTTTKIDEQCMVIIGELLTSRKFQVCPIQMKCGPAGRPAGPPVAHPLVSACLITPYSRAHQSAPLCVLVVSGRVCMSAVNFDRINSPCDWHIFCRASSPNLSSLHTRCGATS